MDHKIKDEVIVDRNIISLQHPPNAKPLGVILTTGERESIEHPYNSSAWVGEGPSIGQPGGPGGGSSQSRAVLSEHHEQMSTDFERHVHGFCTVFVHGF